MQWKRQWAPYCLAVIMGLAALRLQAVPSGCWVIDRAGRRTVGAVLTAEPNGTLHLQLKRGGPTQTFKPGTYRYAYIPKPVAVAQLEQLAAAGKDAAVVQKAPALFKQFKFLGWGDHIAWLHGSALFRQGKAAEALKVFDLGKAYTVLHGVELLEGRVEALIALGRDDDARQELKTLAKSDDRAVAAFVFNARGKLLARQGKKKDAALEFLKTLLLFKPGEATGARKEARKQVVALLKELKDPRYKDFEKFK
ncbi:MAG: hypothetical protein GXP31_03320 [Kiritimatiellaeota bacterium]|nr:hypothetical protein [Kiritimatiellota bacterium]